MKIVSGDPEPIEGSTASGRDRAARMPSAGAASRSVMDLLETRWILRIIEALTGGPHHFADLRRRESPISSPILSQKLMLLERASVVRRRVLNPNMRVVVYELTAWGQARRPVLDAMRAWERSAPRETPADSGQAHEP